MGGLPPIGVDGLGSVIGVETEGFLLELLVGLCESVRGDTLG